MKKILSIVAILSLVFSPVTPAFAANGTWTANADGDWSTAGNWSGATVANAAGFTADFSTINITATRTVTLDTAARTIGNLTFGDTTVSNHGWVLADAAGPAGNVLTLDNTGGSGAPTITVGDLGTGKTDISLTLAGTAGFTKAGVGILELSGTNTYTGTTTVNAGTLTLSSGTAIVDTEAVTVSGGTLNITGAETVGAVTLSSGTITGTAALTGSSYALTDSGTVSTVLAGGVALTKTGAGTATLSAANTYSGLTTVSAGTLAYGINNALNAGAVTVNGGILDIKTFTDTVGAVTLTSGTITGTTGVLTGTSYAMQSGTISAILGGAGVGLTKTTAGTLTFSGSHNTYTGTTAINVGTVVISGATTLDGNVTQAAVATLDLGSNTLTLDGAGAGNYTQTLATTVKTTILSSTTAGNISSTAGVITMGAGNQLVVTVPAGTKLSVGTQWTILDGAAAGTIVAPSITSNNPRLVFTTANSTANDLILTLSSGATANAYTAAATGGNNEAVATTLQNISNPTGDMQNVLNLLDTESDANINTALGTMTPDVSTGSAQASRAITANSFTMVSNRLGGARAGAASSGVASGDMMNGTGVWIQGLGSHMKQDERGGIEGYQANLWGTSIGADKLVDKHVRVGLAGSYGWAGVNSKTPGSPSDDINSYQATVYGSYDSLDLCKAREQGKNSRAAVRNQGENLWYVDGMAAFTGNNYDSRREIWLTPTTARVAKADHYSQQYSTNFEGGYTFTFEDTKALEVTPFASIGYNYLYMNKYKEKGADALNLSVDGEGYHQLEQGLGTKLAYPIVSEKAGTFIPSVKAAWLYDYVSTRYETNASFAGGGGNFTTEGAKPARNGCLLGAELAFLNKGNMTVTGNWDMEIKDQFMSNTYYGTVRYDF